MTDRRRACGPRCAAVLVALFVGGLSLSAARPSSSRTTSAPEARALWVLRTSLPSPRHIDRLVDDAAAAGLNTLFLQVRGRGDAYFVGSPEPRAPDMSTSFDPLAHAIARARRAGLRVHAWINVNLVASAVTVPTDPRHVVRTHPEWLMVPRDLARPLMRIDPRNASYLGQLAGWSRDHPQSIEGLYVVSHRARRHELPREHRRRARRALRDRRRSFRLHPLSFGGVRLQPSIARGLSGRCRAIARAGRTAAARCPVCGRPVRVYRSFSRALGAVPGACGSLISRRGCARPSSARVPMPC